MRVCVLERMSWVCFVIMTGCVHPVKYGKGRGVSYKNTKKVEKLLKIICDVRKKVYLCILKQYVEY